MDKKRLIVVVGIVLLMTAPFCLAAQASLWTRFLDFWGKIFHDKAQITGYTIAENLTSDLQNETPESVQQPLVPPLLTLPDPPEIVNTLSTSNETQNETNDTLQEVTSAILAETSPPRDETTQELIDRIEQKINELQGTAENLSSNISKDNESKVDEKNSTDIVLSSDEEDIQNSTNERVENSTELPLTDPILFDPKMHISEPREVGSPILITYEPTDATAKFFLTLQGVTAEIATNSFVPQLPGAYMVSAMFEKDGITKSALEQIYVEGELPASEETLQESAIQITPEQPMVEIVEPSEVPEIETEETPEIPVQETTQVPVKLDLSHNNPQAYDLRIKGELFVDSTLEFEIIPEVQDPLFQLKTEQITLFLRRPSYTPSSEGQHIITAIIPTENGEVVLERTFDVKTRQKLPDDQIIIPLSEFSSSLNEGIVEYTGTFNGPAIVELPEEAFDVEVNYIDATTFAMQGKTIRTPVEVPISDDGFLMSVSQFNAKEEQSPSLSGFVIRKENDQEGIITRFLRKLINSFSTSPTGFAIANAGTGTFLELQKGLFEVTFSTKAKNKPKDTPSETKDFCDYPIGYDLHVSSELICKNSVLSLNSLRIDQGAVMITQNTIISSKQTRIDGILRMEGDYLLQNSGMSVGPVGGISLAESSIYFNVSQNREFGLDIEKGGKLNMGKGSHLNNAAPIGEKNMTFLLSFDVQEYSLIQSRDN